MIVAGAALVVAVAGTAIAAPLATKALLNKKEKNQTRSIAQSEITKAAPGLSVASAQNATNAQSADGAQTVNGHGATCPAGTFLDRGLCFDSNAHATSGFANAIAVCGNAGGDMPTHSQLRNITNASGVNLGSGATAHWVDAVAENDDGVGVNSMTLAESGGLVPDSVSTGTHPYRCVYQLVR
jgi:hypothetical protein